ncbi:MAG: hypothetical protein ACYS0K_14095 [Planctomycetota bacterium]|jgi:hypothetical protein
MPDLGRPTKLTPEVQERVVSALLLGNYRSDAAHFAGVDKATLRRWLARGAEESDSFYGVFRETVLEAESRAKVTAMGCITRAVREGDWRAAAWFLERKWPSEFCAKSQLFLVAKALDEMEKAAEESGAPLPEGAWEQAWAKVAREFSLQLPHAGGLRVGPGAEGGEGFENQEDLDTALRLLGLRGHGDSGTSA